MAKVCVIDVDLSGDVTNIINDDIKRITDANQRAIDSVVADAEKLQAVRQARRKSDDAAAAKLAASHQALLEAHGRGEGLPAQTILTLVTPDIPNMTSYVLRMRTYLRDQGNTHRLESYKQDRVAHYRLVSVS